MELFELADRWLHFGAGVLWIGILYFFNWVNAPFAAVLDAETKRKVVPELMPRALWWFRWGAAFTWVSGLFLLFLVYYHGYDGSNLVEGQREVTAAVWLPGFLGLFVGFLVYDRLFRLLASRHALAVILWALFTLGFAWLCRDLLHYSKRGTYIHVGALFGTCMAANVWMRIWPAQRRIIAAIAAGESPESADAGMAGRRSMHNTYMSVPLLLLMVGSDGKDALLSLEPWYLVLAGILVIGFLVTRALYAKAPGVR